MTPNQKFYRKCHVKKLAESFISFFQPFFKFLNLHSARNNYVRMFDDFLLALYGVHPS